MAFHSFALAAAGIIALALALWVGSRAMDWIEGIPEVRERRDWDRHSQSALRMANHASFPRDFGFEPPSRPQPQPNPEAAPGAGGRSVAVQVPGGMSRAELDAWARRQWKAVVSDLRDEGPQDPK